MLVNRRITFCVHFVNKMFSKMLALVALSQLCCILLCKMHFASQKVLSTVQKCIFASGQKGYSNVFLKCFDMFKNGVNNFFFTFYKITRNSIDQTITIVRSTHASSGRLRVAPRFCKNAFLHSTIAQRMHAPFGRLRVAPWVHFA